MFFPLTRRSSVRTEPVWTPVGGGPGAAVLLVALLLGTGPAHAQIQPLPLPQADSSFGAAVALSGGDGAPGKDHAPERALVGASGEDTCGENSGAAYVFEKTGGTWERAARLGPSDCEAGAFFGRSLALSGDRALVGASKKFFADERPNVAYLFERDPATGAWNETARLTVDPERAEGTFAASVALDGRRALVTARGALPPSSALASGSGASSSSAARSRSSVGAAYVFELGGRTGQWKRVARLRPRRPASQRAFGGAGALDGDYLAVTASPYFSEGAGAVYLFERRRSGDAARWVQATRLEGFDGFSIPVALHGERLLVGASRAGDDRGGAAVLFERTAGGSWQRQARLRPRTPYRDGAFGTAVALGAERALVTGYDEQLGLDFNIDRVAYAFERQGRGSEARWTQQQILDRGDVSFASAIALHGRTALVGHASERGSGAAYIIGLR